MPEYKIRMIFETIERLMIQHEKIISILGLCLVYSNNHLFLKSKKSDHEYKCLNSLSFDLFFWGLANCGKFIRYGC